MTRGRPPKELLERRKRKPRSPRTMPDKTTAADWKFWAGMAIGIPSLLITALALWLAVEDRPTVSLGPQLDAQNLLSTQIIIINNGVLPIRDVSFAIYVKDCKIKEAGAIELTDMVVGNYEPPTKILRPGERVTTTFNAVAGRQGFTIWGLHENAQFLEFDIALVAKFRPTWAPFWNRTRAFRFKAVPTSTGVIMQQIPAGDIESVYERRTGH